jgi:oxygen-dependent protoporphyrinogen oxidase
MGLHASPEFVRIIRHRRGIPQYTVGHLDRLERIDARLRAHPGLYLAGNSYRGVSVNSCVAEAGPLADRILADEAAERPHSMATETSEVT